MINLLPSDTKKQLRSSRTNLLLIKYTFVLIFAAVFLAISYFVVNMNLDDAKEINNTDSSVVNNSTSSSENQQVQKAITSLTNASGIIDQQISYNKILLSLANTLPKGVIIASIYIDNNTINRPVEIKLHAINQDNVAELNSRFQNSSTFRNYQVVSNNSTSTNPGYPIDLTISVNINKASIK